MLVAVMSSNMTLESMVDGINAPYMLLLEVINEEFKLKNLLQNPAAKAIHKKGKAAAIYVLRHHVDIVVTSDIGPCAFEEFISKGVKVYLAENITVKEAMRKLIRGELMEAKKPTHERGMHGRYNVHKI